MRRRDCQDGLRAAHPRPPLRTRRSLRLVTQSTSHRLQSIRIPDFPDFGDCDLEISGAIGQRQDVRSIHVLEIVGTGRKSASGPAPLEEVVHRLGVVRYVSVMPSVFSLHLMQMPPEEEGAVQCDKGVLWVVIAFPHQEVVPLSEGCTIWVVRVNGKRISAVREVQSVVLAALCDECERGIERVSQQQISTFRWAFEGDVRQVWCRAGGVILPYRRKRLCLAVKSREIFLVTHGDRKAQPIIVEDSSWSIESVPALSSQMIGLKGRHCACETRRSGTAKLLDLGHHL